MDRIPTKIKWKIHAPFILYFKLSRYVLQKFLKYSQIFYFLVAFISFYLSRYPFSQIFRTSFNTTICRKDFCHNFFLNFNGFTQTLYPLNDQNLLSVTKVFCRCSLHKWQKQDIKIPEPTEFWIQHQRETESNWDRQKPTATKKVLRKLHWKTPVPESLFQ